MYHATKEAGTVPTWLHEDDLIYSEDGTTIYGLHSPAFRSTTAFKIKADHWAVRPLRAGLTPWAGGNSAPADHNGGSVMCRNGDMYAMWGISRWDHKYGDMDIIGYPKRATAPAAPPLSLANQLHRVMHPDASPWSATEAHERGARFIIERERATLDKLKNLFRALYTKHVEQPAPPYQLHDDISGVIDQIDNLTTAWKAPDPDSVTMVRMTEAEVKTLGANYMFGWNAEIDADADFVTHVFRRLGLIKPDPTTTMLDQFAVETGVTITDDNRAAIVQALSWHRDA